MQTCVIRWHQVSSDVRQAVNRFTERVYKVYTFPLHPDFCSKLYFIDFQQYGFKNG